MVPTDTASETGDWIRGTARVAQNEMVQGETEPMVAFMATKIGHIAAEEAIPAMRSANTARPVLRRGLCAHLGLSRPAMMCAPRCVQPPLMPMAEC